MLCGIKRIDVLLLGYDFLPLARLLGGKKKKSLTGIRTGRALKRSSGLFLCLRPGSAPRKPPLMDVCLTCAQRLPAVEIPPAPQAICNSACCPRYNKVFPSV